MENMRRVSEAIKCCSSDEFNPVLLFDSLPGVVSPQEKLEKDYSIR